MSQSMTRAEKWRLILGRAVSTKEVLEGLPEAESITTFSTMNLSGQWRRMEGALERIYGGKRFGGSGDSSPKVATWLDDIRACFPVDSVKLLQQDALKVHGLSQILFEPEILDTLVPSVELAAQILQMKEAIPDHAKDSARRIVAEVAEEIRRRLADELQTAVHGQLDRSRHSPLKHSANLDIATTLRRNLKHWDREHQRIILERPCFFARRKRSMERQIIVALDQSGSMAPSLVYGAVTASILASLNAVQTHLVTFDTEVVDLSDRVDDPVDVLLGIQLGGGTDINRAVGYCQTLVQDPQRAVLLLVTDLYEGGRADELLVRLENLATSGVRVVCLLAMDDRGEPAYDHRLAQQVRNLGIPVMACPPQRLADMLGGLLE